MTGEPVYHPPGPDVRLITVSASYGAGGSVVAPALAKRLGLPFLQRVTTSEGHPAEPGPCDEQLTDGGGQGHPDAPATRLVHRGDAGRADPVAAVHPPPGPSTCAATAKPGSSGCCAGGGGVILGRAAAVVLGKDRGFHVRLDGPPDRRVVPGRRDRGHQRGGGPGAPARGRQGPHRLRPPPVPHRPGRPGPVPPGDRLHRDTAGRRHRAHPGHRPRPQRRVARSCGTIVTGTGPALTGGRRTRGTPGR